MKFFTMIKSLYQAITFKLDLTERILPLSAPGTIPGEWPAADITTAAPRAHDDPAEMPQSAPCPPPARSDLIALQLSPRVVSSPPRLVSSPPR